MVTHLVLEYCNLLAVYAVLFLIYGWTIGQVCLVIEWKWYGGGNKKTGETFMEKFFIGALLHLFYLVVPIHFVLKTLFRGV